MLNYAWSNWAARNLYFILILNNEFRTVWQFSGMLNMCKCGLKLAHDFHHAELVRRKKCMPAEPGQMMPKRENSDSIFICNQIQRSTFHCLKRVTTYLHLNKEKREFVLSFKQIHKIMAPLCSFFFLMSQFWEIVFKTQYLFICLHLMFSSFF